MTIRIWGLVLIWLSLWAWAPAAQALVTPNTPVMTDKADYAALVKRVQSLTFKPTHSLSHAISEFHLGRFTGILESTKQADLMASLKSGVSQHQGDAGDSEKWLCYRYGRVDHDEKVLLSSNELYYQSGIINEIRLRPVPPKEPVQDKCPRLDTIFTPVKIGANIGIGVGEANVTKALGQPAAKQGAWRVFVYRGQVKGAYQGESVLYDEWVSFFIHLNKSAQIDYIEFIKSTTN